MYNFHLTYCPNDTSLVNLALVLSSFAFILSIVFHFSKPATSRTLIIAERDHDHEPEEESDPVEEPEEEVEEEREPTEEEEPEEVEE